MKKLVQAYKLSFTEGELSQLDPNELSIVAVTCYAVTELNALMRLYLFCAPEIEEGGIQHNLNVVQRSVILRVWSAKLFEYHDFISNIKDGGEGRQHIRRLKSIALKCFERKKRLPGYPLFQSLRHEATNHYSTKAARKNLRHIGKNAELSMLLSEEEGNSYYLLGEEVMFAARFNRFTSNRKSIEERISASGEWLDVNMSITSWSRRVHHVLVSRLLLAKFPDKKFRQQNLWLPSDHVAEDGEINVPLFLQPR